MCDVGRCGKRLGKPPLKKWTLAFSSLHHRRKPGLFLANHNVNEEAMQVYDEEVAKASVPTKGSSSWLYVDEDKHDDETQGWEQRDERQVRYPSSYFCTHK